MLIGRKPQAPILTRLDTFLRSRLVRRVVTVRNPKLDFRLVTDRRLIFLGKLAAGTIGEENAALLGSLLVSKFHQVSLARAGRAVDERRPFFLYIDEFHHVATPSMATLFSGMRKYRLGLTVAHQDLYQLHRTVPEVERSLMANAYTRICFRVGEEDARQLARGFSYFDADDLMKLGLGETICRVGGRDRDFNLRTEDLPELDAPEGGDRRAAVREISSQTWQVPAQEDAEGISGRAEEPEARSKVESVQGDESLTDRLCDEESAPEARKGEAEQPSIDKEALDYLELVASEPFLSVRERNAHLGLSAWKGQQVKTTLLDAGLVREVPVNPGGRGERFKLLEFTAAGRGLLSDFGMAQPTGRGRGGVAHQWWVDTIAAWLEAQGISSSIEDESRGVRVDLLMTAGRKKVAIEIEMTEGHAVENIRKDLEAGFDTVISLLDDSSSLERITQQLSSDPKDVPPKVVLGHLQEYEGALAHLITLDGRSLRAANQNKERKRQRRRAPRQSAPGPSLRSALSEPGVLSTPLAAEYVGLRPATLETMRIRGGGPTFVKLGRRVVYRREDLDAWLEERKRGSTSDPGTSPG